MKSFAMGLSARVFGTTISFGRRAMGNSTGNALTSKHVAENLNAEAGKIVTKRPVARRLVRTSEDSVTTVVRG